jgi:hypothetical protein
MILFILRGRSVCCRDVLPSNLRWKELRGSRKTIGAEAIMHRMAKQTPLEGVVISGLCLPHFFITDLAKMVRSERKAWKRKALTLNAVESSHRRRFASGVSISAQTGNVVLRTLETPIPNAAYVLSWYLYSRNNRKQCNIILFSHHPKVSLIVPSNLVSSFSRTGLVKKRLIPDTKASCCASELPNPVNAMMTTGFNPIFLSNARI